MRPAAPPDGFATFVASRSPTLLRAAWLLTGDETRDGPAVGAWRVMLNNQLPGQELTSQRCPSDWADTVIVVDATGGRGEYWIFRGTGCQPVLHTAETAREATPDLLAALDAALGPAR
jgi:hypothetical protein